MVFVVGEDRFYSTYLYCLLECIVRKASALHAEALEMLTYAFIYDVYIRFHSTFVFIFLNMVTDAFKAVY